jgi:protein-S-isoprenylcysteine O-methyltransferase Ste14
MTKAFLSSLMMLLIPAGVLFPPAVCAAAAFTPPFPGKWWMTGFLAAATLERVWAMFFQHRERFSTRVEQDWTAVAVGYAYAITLYGTAIDTLFIRRSAPSPSACAAGLVLYGAALALRYGAMAHLRHQWTVQLDRGDVGNRFLVTSGPYGWVRHPLYTAACMETLAVPLSLLSWPALAVAAFAFVPSEIFRARFEERYLRRTFGADYDAYAARTGAFLPRWKRGGPSPQAPHR